MKFSQNGLYIESYTKCANCGVLIYEASEVDAANKVQDAGKIYCSQWCVDWKTERDERKARSAAA
ncbi:MAG: hypothetical protein MEQ84_11620 [Mesorhizobium sp.]|nr:hypothetical protein [Mesorhizobium sp.]